MIRMENHASFKKLKCSVKILIRTFEWQSMNFQPFFIHFEAKKGVMGSKYSRIKFAVQAARDILKVYKSGAINFQKLIPGTTVKLSKFMFLSGPSFNE